MAVKLRLARAGAKKRPFYRIVAAESAHPRDGRFLDKVGYYDPKADPPVIHFYEEKLEYWLSRGAQPTETVRSLLRKVRRGK